MSSYLLILHDLHAVNAIELADGRIEPFDHVISTMPLTLLVRGLGEMPAHVTTLAVDGGSGVVLADPDADQRRQFDAALESDARVRAGERITVTLEPGSAPAAFACCNICTTSG